MMADVVGSKRAIRFDPTKPNGTLRKSLDSRRMRALGWRPQIDELPGLKTALADLQRLLASGAAHRRL